ncbi:flagellar hook-length control protein FliK [Balneatrix alpica]|uniref:Flagellar hook-length control protein FliK n=1 Tax=Balneatrix alpica TaxID=75684 RepID=A0ABV5ZE36_9GAMM|nr:flagellar hook-length control protein FliK [Balneatrix alpica]
MSLPMPNGGSQVQLRTANGQQLQAFSQLPLQSGQEVTLRAQTPTQLQLVGGGLSQELSTLQQGLRQALPRQLEPGQLQNLLALLKLPAQSLGISPQAWQALHRLSEGLPNRESLKQPDTLRQAVQDSGFFSETRLLKGQDVSRDHKVQLLQLAALLPDNHPLKKLVEGRLAKVQVSQIQNLLRQEPQQDSQQLQLLINNQQQLEALDWRIQRREHSLAEEEEPQRHWQIDIELEPDQEGKLHLRLDWQHSLAITLWVPNQTWQQRISKADWDQLAQHLQQRGIPVQLCQCFIGEPPSSAQTSNTHTPLIDTRA